MALVVVADLFAANVRGYQLADPAIVERHSPIGAYLQAQPGLQRVVTPFDAAPDRFPDLREFESQWLQAAVMLEPCFGMAYRVGNSLAYTGMVPARADRLRRRLPAREQVPHLGLFGVGYLVVPTSLERARSVGAEPPWNVLLTDSAVPAFLLQVPHRERAYLAAELSAVDRRGALEFVLGADAAVTSRSVVEAPVPQGYRPPAGSVRIVTDEAEHVAIETEASSAGLLVLNDIVTAGWTATIDGSPASILAANYLARAVWVGSGTHRVEFRYRTPMLGAGWAVFLIGAAALAATGIHRSTRPVPSR
jgi:hypothetical protein